MKTISTLITILLLFFQSIQTINAGQNPCNCLIPIDTTFSIVPFDGSGGSGGPGVAPEYRNDDWSSAAVVLPFNLCMYGNTYNTIYINNNGSISFGAAYSTFTSTFFPTSAYSLLSPFWADVDTRDPGSGLVYYKINPTSLIVIWDGVGYFNTHSDLRNRFQLVITDGSDPLVTQGNISFCYGDMQWTTGDASSGLNGFGGTPAVAGINPGNGSDYVQLGTFDSPGNLYDGPGGLNDGVDWLDYAHFIIDACPVNVPPVSLDCRNDTITMHVGDSALMQHQFIAPEVNQSMTVNFQHSLTNFTTLSTTGNDYLTVVTRLIADAANIGYNTLTVTATDNGSPQGVTTYSRVIQILPFTGIDVPERDIIRIFPNPMSEQASIETMLEGSCHLKLLDLAGRIIRSEEVNAKHIDLRRDGLSEGSYLIVITTPDGREFCERLTVR